MWPRCHFVTMGCPGCHSGAGGAAVPSPAAVTSLGLGFGVTFGDIGVSLCPGCVSLLCPLHLGSGVSPSDSWWHWRDSPARAGCSTPQSSCEFPSFSALSPALVASQCPQRCHLRVPKSHSSCWLVCDTPFSLPFLPKSASFGGFSLISRWFWGSWCCF